jgi:hypothetical protein
MPLSSFGGVRRTLRNNAIHALGQVGADACLGDIPIAGNAASDLASGTSD